MNKQIKLFNVHNETELEDEKYSKKITAPQYMPSNRKPHIAELYNSEKYSKLIYNINNSSVTDEEKQFLKLAASRHIVFNYSQIADYYANADSEMQELMEQSALVILDLDDAISNGFVKLNKQIKSIMEESGRATKNEK